MTTPSNPCVGVLELASKYRYGITRRGVPIYLFRPYDKHLPDYIVGSSERNVTQNQIAYVTVPVSVPEEPGVKARATLVKLVGPVGDYAAERAALLQHYAGCATAPVVGETTREAEPPREFLDADHGWTTFHVDPPGCRDVDDALAWHRETDCWAITIADVAAIVEPGFPLDCAAHSLGATFYDLDGRVERPMFPAALSEGEASLTPSASAKRGVTLFWSAGNGGRFARTWIRVAETFTYESFSASPLAAATARAFHLPETADTHDIIETAMIRYNQAAALRLVEVGAGLLRVQEKGVATPVSDDLKFLAMEAARYEPVTATNSIHSAIHSAIGSLYCHATSPLRRYADLVNQRILVTGATFTATAELAAHLNARSKANRRWGRDLTFLTFVTPGRVHEMEVVGYTDTHVWVPVWKRLLRHTGIPPGSPGRIRIFCDPTQRSWKERVRTAPPDTK